MNYKQSKFFSEFQCIGSSCINNCCHHFVISWSAEGVERLRSAENCSDELRELARNSFVPADDGKFNIKLRDDGKCPFQLENGLCIIQKELEEEYLSGACRLFPRCYFTAGNTVYCSGVLSCHAIFRKLLEEDNAAALLTASEKPDIRGQLRAPANKSRYAPYHPELNYHKELFEFFYEIISDRRFSAEVNIVRGALAAEKLTECRGNKIVRTINELREALCDPDVIQVVESVEPEYEQKLRMLTDYTEITFDSMLADLFRDGSGQADPSRFAYASEKVNALLKPFRFRNIALGLLFEMEVPFRFRSKTIYENYAEYAVVCAVVKMCVMAAALDEELPIEMSDGRQFDYQGIDRITAICSFVLRKINQGVGTIKELSERFKTSSLTPRDIGMLIK